MDTTRVSIGLPSSIAAVVFAAAGLAWSPSASADVVIDDFSTVDAGGTPWPHVQDSLGFVDVTENGTGQGINGTRTSRIVLTSQAGGSDSVTIDVDVNAPGMNADGVLSYNSTAGAQGAIALIYDGGGLELDLSGEGALLIDFESASWTLDVIRTTLTMFDEHGAMATGRFDLVSPGAQTQTINFASLDFINTLDLSVIERIEVAFDAQEDGSDFAVSQIYTVVPGPATIAVLGMFGLAGRRRRRRTDA